MSLYPPPGMPFSPLLTRPDLVSAFQRMLLNMAPNGQPLSDIETISAHENTAVLDQMINEANFITLAGFAVNTVVVQKSLDPGMLGILRAVALQTPNQADIFNLIWQVQVNGNAVIGLDSIQGPMATLLFPKPTLIPLYKNSVVRIVAASLIAAPIVHVTAMLYGNFFPPLGG
jgi:hypothetical protein